MPGDLLEARCGATLPKMALRRLGLASLRSALPWSVRCVNLANEGLASLCSALPWSVRCVNLANEGLASLRSALPWSSVSKAIRDEPGRLCLRISAAAFESELSTALR